ncbi:hypothetical protein CEXT_147021 [Caerostris extrusa]|uniref:Uncharacterized protein n=1 Tax=Caerostris extrusa TaxID=172846 RepID=A0AAV4P8K0_CAEEX|nr:hypothetical protein CEXT_147021 [Caerostris extrusa]
MESITSNHFFCMWWLVDGTCPLSGETFSVVTPFHCFPPQAEKIFPYGPEKVHSLVHLHHTGNACENTHHTVTSISKPIL